MSLPNYLPLYGKHLKCSSFKNSQIYFTRDQHALATKQMNRKRYRYLKMIEKP